VHTTNYERRIRNSLSRMMKESRNVDNYGHFVSAPCGSCHACSLTAFIKDHNEI
jgi:hypothetical protein